jgi:hypothetical protein
LKDRFSLILCLKDKNSIAILEEFIQSVFDEYIMKNNFENIIIKFKYLLLLIIKILTYFILKFEIILLQKLYSIFHSLVEDKSPRKLKNLNFLL